MRIDQILLLKWFGYAFKQDRIIIHDSLEVTPTMRSLARLLTWLMVRVYRSFLFCCCSNVGEERGLFADGQVSVVQHGKIKITMVPLSIVLNLMNYSLPACQLVLVS